MHAMRIGAILGAVALTMVTVPASDAQAVTIACGGGASTGRVSVHGCISSETGTIDHPFRHVTAYVKLKNTGNRALTVSYEAFGMTQGDTGWTKMGNSRTNVGPGQDFGPEAVGTVTRWVCAPGKKVSIRVRAQAAGAAWSTWSPASTKQCTT
ncbi:hypothetical protein ACFV0Y_23825 [Streptomyces sp. NPDC059569]|uniref:hypothetical protein n=1 Tax=Streptomyces sp. NPDC059569 TaxID=3346869 RepID=UPI0036A1CACE